MPIPPLALLERAAKVRAIVLDVDGVLTDASLFYGSGGEALKRFSARDGFGIKLARMEGLTVAILSGRVAPPLASRLADLGIPGDLVIQGSRDKGHDIDVLLARLQMAAEELAFMGDDIPDLPALRRCGLAACPADAVPEVKEVCHFVADTGGGAGAVRALVEVILKGHRRWDALLAAWSEGRVPEAFETGGDGRR